MKEKIIACVKATPGITAKEIGRNLGVTRKSINQLIQNYSCLSKDNKTYGWIYIDKNQPIIIELPSKWIDSLTFEKALEKSEYTTVEKSDLTIVFLAGTKLMMDSTARLLCLVNQIAESGRNVILDLSLAKDSRSYLNRAGFYDVLHENVNITPNRPKRNLAMQYKGNAPTLVEFRKFDSKERKDEIPQLLFDNLTHFLNEQYDAIFTFIAEIYNNVYDHVFDLQTTTLHAFAACQTYKRSNNVVYTQVVISDCGQGICKTLRPALKNNSKLDQYRELNDIDLIVEAFKVGRITRHNPETDPGHGMGLYIGAKKAQDMNAKISIRQENFLIVLEWKKERLILKKAYEDLKSIPGTNICFDFSVEKS